MVSILTVICDKSETEETLRTYAHSLIKIFKM